MSWVVLALLGFGQLVRRQACSPSRRNFSPEALPLPLPKREGSEAPTGAGAERRTSCPPCGSGRSFLRKGPPANDAGRRASRRFARRSCLGAGPRFRPDTAPDRQRAPRGRLVVACRAEPRRRPSICLRGKSAGAGPIHTNGATGPRPFHGSGGTEDYPRLW
jgi:hypothetical protein